MESTCHSKSPLVECASSMPSSSARAVLGSACRAVASTTDALPCAFSTQAALPEPCQAVLVGL